MESIEVRGERDFEDEPEEIDADRTLMKRLFANLLADAEAAAAGK